MTSRNNKHQQRGFSVVELIIVLIIVGILAALILNSLQTIKAKARDAQRRTDLAAIAKQLEDCFTDTCNGYYPSLIQLTDTSDSGFVVTHFKHFDADALFDNSHGTIQQREPSAAAQYQYVATPANCTGTAGATPCTGYTLRTYQETNPEHPYVKESFNKAD